MMTIQGAEDQGPADAVAVIGTGAVGSMALWSLASRAGVPVHGYDSYAPGHDRGGYGGDSRIFRIAYQEGAQYVPMLLRARELWRELEGTTGSSLLNHCGGLTIGGAGDPGVERVRDATRQFDLPHARITAEEGRHAYPHLAWGSGDEAVLDHSSGVLRPEKAVAAAAHYAEVLGARLHRYSTVSDLTADSDGVTVVADGHEARYWHVILAPGPWAHELSFLDALPLEIHEITTAWFPIRAPHADDLKDAPVVIRNGAHAFSCFPSLDGETVKVSQHSVPRPRITSPESAARNPEPKIFTALRETVRRHLPGLRPDPIRVGTYADCFTPDGHGILGSIPSLPGVTIATGFSGHGFKLAPTLGEAAADLALTGATTHGIAHLSPQRFT